MPLNIAMHEAVFAPLPHQYQTAVRTMLHELTQAALAHKCSSSSQKAPACIWACMRMNP